jgi:xanthine dehydrogenase YagS FAD-binding subunit
VKPFRYERAADADAAVAAVATPNAAYLGGGTNLVDLMRLGVEAPDVLVDVSRLGPARCEPSAGGGLIVPGSMRNSDLAADETVRSRYPMLALALLSGASGQLRNAATVAGNLLQRTRCVYFQDVTKPCNKRSPGTGCPAIEGENRNLAIIGHSSHCVATHPSDMAVALTALDAAVHLVSSAGARVVPLRDFYRLPDDEPQLDTTVEPGELVTAVELPQPAAGRSTYRKVRDRASFSFAVVSVAASVAVRDGVVADVRIAFGGIAHRPWRAAIAEQELRGGPPDLAAFRKAADAELRHARPLRDNAFKVTVARNVLINALQELTAP